MHSSKGKNADADKLHEVFDELGFKVHKKDNLEEGECNWLLFSDIWKPPKVTNEVRPAK